MFDAKEIAKKLAGKGGGVEIEVDDPMGDDKEAQTGPEDALRDMFNAMKSGHFDVAADAFMAAVMHCEAMMHGDDDSAYDDKE